MRSKFFREMSGGSVGSGRSAPVAQERRIASETGGKAHKRSGAGWTKWDGSSRDWVWDAKHTDGDRIALPVSMLDHLCRDGICQGKRAFLELEFLGDVSGVHRWYMVPLGVFDELVMCDGVSAPVSCGVHAVKGSSVSVSRSRVGKLPPCGYLRFDIGGSDSWVLLGSDTAKGLMSWVRG